MIKAAAVADYRVRRPAEQKIKGKRDLTLDLTPNPDILAEVAARATGSFIVGFAAETNDVVANARAKLEAKGIDLLVANDVSRRDIGFDAEDNEVLVDRPLGRQPRAAAHAEARGGRRDPRTRSSRCAPAHPRAGPFAERRSARGAGRRARGARRHAALPS